MHNYDCTLYSSKGDRSLNESSFLRDCLKVSIAAQVAYISLAAQSSPRALRSSAVELLATPDAGAMPRQAAARGERMDERPRPRESIHPRAAEATCSRYTTAQARVHPPQPHPRHPLRSLEPKVLRRAAKMRCFLLIHGRHAAPSSQAASAASHRRAAPHSRSSAVSAAASCPSSAWRSPARRAQDRQEQVRLRVVA